MHPEKQKQAERLEVRVHGQVQGVGFRPFVYRLAIAHGLTGWVRNDSAGVQIEVQGGKEALQRFVSLLRQEPPPLARVDTVVQRQLPLQEGACGFHVAQSLTGQARTGITPDAATCRDCVAELFDPTDRRYRYAFINCTACGPRYTITRGLPYDRPNTSMARFAMCELCRAEYHDPADRRFHAQPNACPACGPELSLADSALRTLQEGDVVKAAVARLRRGEIVAIKGLGGFHLACDAHNAEAVARLRARKMREAKPFAVMAANVDAARQWVRCDDAQAALLESVTCSIVLLRKKREVAEQLRGVADGLDCLGVMLPYTPLHHVLFRELADADPSRLVVLTSANPGGEPLVTGNDEAVTRLGGIADAFVMHNRDIVVGCDDSVTITMGERPMVLRRGRGLTPASIRLPRSGPAVVGLGGFMKNAACVTRGPDAFLSQHIGELDDAATCEALERSVAHLLAVLEVAPDCVAHDLHPDFFSTRLAEQLAALWQVKTVAVQHHHAHVAAVMAENGVSGPAIGLALDGVGLGTDRTAWGGELLLVDGASMKRLGHLRHLPMPGGDRAAREPWRMAAAALHILGRGEEIGRRLRHEGAASVAKILAADVRCPPTSSAGRLFDAAAGLLSVCDVNAFDGQAAMLLTALAWAHGPAAPLEQGFFIDEHGVLDFSPLLEALADTDGVASEAAAAMFHATLCQGLAQWVRTAAQREGVRDVALAGGCFANQILASTLPARLADMSLRVYEASAAPVGDGGLALGQAWVALCELGTHKA